MLNANEIFNRVYEGAVNFMTPEIIERGKLDKFSAYELSRGKDFSGNYMWGVTVCSYIPETDEKIRYRNISRCFFNRSEALEYIDYLKENFHELKYE